MRKSKEIAELKATIKWLESNSVKLSDESKWQSKEVGILNQKNTDLKRKLAEKVKEVENYKLKSEGYSQYMLVFKDGGFWEGIAFDHVF